MGTGKKFILLFGAICALIPAATALILYWLARHASGSAYFWVMLVLTVLAVSVASGVLAVFLLGRLLRQLLSDARTLVPDDGSAIRPPRRLSAVLDEFHRLSEQISANQESLHRRNRELRVLATVSLTLDRASSLKEMLDTVLEQTSDLLPHKRAYISLVDEETGEFHILASRGYTAEELDSVSIDIAQVYGAQRGVNLPLRTTSRVIGVFHLDAQPPDQHMRPSLQRWPQQLAEILAAAVEKRRLFEAAQSEVRAQVLLNEVGRALTSTLDKQKVLTRIMQVAIQTLNAEFGSVMLVDEERKDLFFAAAVGPGADLSLGMRMPLGKGLVGWAIRHSESVLVADAQDDPRFYGQIDQQTGLSTRSMLCVPMISKNKAIGVIEVIDSRRGRFTKSDLRLLEAFAPQAATAIDNASLHESIKAQMAELERTQDQLLQAEKLSAIGRLVAGVAHELNNPLTAIVGYSQLLLETCEDEQISEDLERIDREAQRCANIVESLLSFARQSKMAQLAIKLGDVLNKTLDLLAYQLEMDNITLVREISPESMMILGDRYQLQQVFLNLIDNAHQEMRKTHGLGTLTVRAYPTEQRTVQVKFIDDGPGISRENISRLFDPFFTTRDVGQGTGLGLSICLGIVQEHQGRIWAESEPGQGATFLVELPLYLGPQQGEDLREAVKELPFVEKQAVLVVDDEVEIARLLKRILEAEGHSVTAAYSGSEAREALDERTFDLVICDLRMPGMSGQELYAHIKQTQPDLARRVVFLTGDVMSRESQTFLEEAGNQFVSKPFKRQRVLEVLEEMRTG